MLSSRASLSRDPGPRLSRLCEMGPGCSLLSRLGRDDNRR